MSKPLDILRLRGARDFVIDLLGIGETHPLQDVHVPDGRLTVPIDTPAKILVRPGQPEVRYRLYGPDGNPVTPEPGVSGVEDGTELETPPILEDVTFSVHAEKIVTGHGVFLHARAAVKSRLNLALEARILAPAVTVGGAAVTDGDPRIVDYGVLVSVEIDESQEGVDYHLVHVLDGEEVVLSDHVRGDLGTIVLESIPTSEDTVIHIRATKSFGASEEHDTQTDLLDRALPLYVRANPGVTVDVRGTNVFRGGQTARVTVDDTQRSVTYVPYVRQLTDQDFGHEPGFPDPVFHAPVPGGDPVPIARPRDFFQDAALGGYEQAHAGKAGTGGTIEFPVGPLSDDSIVVVRAGKAHGADPSVPSNVPVADPAVAFVLPSATPDLAFGVRVRDGATFAGVLVGGGDPGVRYHLRRGQDGEEIARPAYVHKRDPIEASQNRGIGSLWIGIDLAIARDPETQADEDPATTAPATPLVALESIPMGEELHVRAVKARSGVHEEVVPVAHLHPLPVIELDSDTVVVGQSARVVVRKSVTGERYELTLNGETLSRPRNGNGEDLAFLTGPLSEDTTFVLRVTRPGESGIEVTRNVDVDVSVDAGEG